jgi:hypothetical protein
MTLEEQLLEARAEIKRLQRIIADLLREKMEAFMVQKSSSCFGIT